MADLLMKLELEPSYYFVADAYYTNQKIIKGMLASSPVYGEEDVYIEY
jgi:hypothetical protein